MSFWRRNALKHISGSGSCCWNIITIIAKKSYHKSSWDWEQGRWNAFIPCSHNLFKNDKYFLFFMSFYIVWYQTTLYPKVGKLLICSPCSFCICFCDFAESICFLSCRDLSRIMERSDSAHCRGWAPVCREERSNPQKFRKSKLILRHRRASKTMVSGIDCGLICFCVFGQLSNVA